MKDTLLERIQSLNPKFSIYSVFSEQFKRYGSVLSGYDFTRLLSLMENTPMPEEGNIYVASDAELENAAVAETVRSNLYGDMDIQIGYCNGKNSTLNGLEYHKCSEVNIAATDLVLLLGKVQNIQNNQYAVEHVTGFYIPQGTAVELFATTLHFAPCKTADEGFKCVVILTRGTNEPLLENAKAIMPEDELLFMRNKWLIAHPERKILMDRGAYPGIIGENIELHYE